MSLNATPQGERIHVALFGRRNVGKSSLVNALTGQEMSIVSEVKGTTTDPVRKAMELLPLGPVLMIDTPGLDDEGVLGEMRVRRTHEILNQTDVALVVTEAGVGVGDSTTWSAPISHAPVAGRASPSTSVVMPDAVRLTPAPRATVSAGERW